MKDIPRGWSVIPKAAWYVAVALAVAIGLLMMGAAKGTIGEAPHMPSWALLLASLFVPLITGVMVLVYGFIYGDAQRRRMRAVLWLLLAIFIPNAIGIILYFVLRDPLPVPCPSCATPVNHGFAYCPSCGTQVADVCPGCGKQIQPDWLACAHCGTKLR